MLLRLILALTIALLPMPAVAACHTPAPEPMAHHAGMDHPPARHQPETPLPVEQLCIGCVAPATILPPRVPAPLGHALALASPRRIGGETLAPYGPETPPPRTEA